MMDKLKSIGEASIKHNVTLSISDKIFKHSKKVKEEKFIVINFKRLYEIEELTGNPSMDFEKMHPECMKLLDAINIFEAKYKEITGKKMSQKYIVCNQDEPYAEAIWEIILNK